MKLTDERIEEIKAAEKAATPGPWENIPAWNVVEKVGDDVPLMDCLHREDAQLVVILRNTIPELLTEREEREWLLKEAREERDLEQAMRLRADSRRIAVYARSTDKLETRAESAEAENAALREQIEAVRELASQWSPNKFAFLPAAAARERCGDQIRAILNKKANGQ